MPNMNNNNFNSSSPRPTSGNGSPGSWTSPLSSPVGMGRPPSLMDHPHSLPNAVRVVVTRDAGGYGMKVSGDNPVYVQSVKDGGPAEKAGLHAGDKIIQVNGTNVTHSTHTEVVGLIKAHAQVVLTVQPRMPLVRSPSTRPASLPSSTKITAPQPVDNEKQHQLQQEKEQYYRLMIEKEQHHLDKLRSEVGSNEKRYIELAKAEKNLRCLQDNLTRTLTEQLSPESQSNRPISSPSNLGSPIKRSESDDPPPIPKRYKHHDINSLFLSNEINSNSPKRENVSGDVPPPLPPRTYPPYNTHTDDASAANSIDKQMSYPLVATCTSLHSDYLSQGGKHHRTKSNPDCLTNDGSGEQRHPATPPGTPPPPYPSPDSARRFHMLGGDSFDGSFSFPNNDAFAQERSVSQNSHARPTNSRTAQQAIISMEDDDISDLEIDQVEDHGYFKSLSRLWEHLPHLAVFMNYILSNSDPNSLLFYLLTDLYKEGNAKEMRKWAFEIHSCFLVPGAPLRLNNVDENIAREIDDNLTKQYDKEEIMRKIFWKARQRAKEELTRQLADFQQKRTAGLGTMYGPTDQELMDHYNDKAKETKLYESLLLPKVDPYLEDMEKFEPQKYYMGAALFTILTRVFRVRPQNFDLDKVPTFVNKERSFKAKLIGKYSRKSSRHLSHQFVDQQYFTVMACNLCHQIIYGISPQGYQCTACLINLHRSCVKLYDDSCPGPIRGKERGIRKLIGMRHDMSEQIRHRKASQLTQMEREKRQMEEKDCINEIIETGKFSQSIYSLGRAGESKVSQPVSRTGSDRRPDAVREEGARPAEDSNSHQQADGSLNHTETSVEKKESMSQDNSASSQAGAKRRAGGHINRSESVKEQSEKIRKQQRRNISDPSHSTNTSSYDVENERQADLSKNTDSGSSSNSSISAVNGRLSESPSNSMDVHQATVRTQSDSDSDMDGEADPLNWQELVTDEELKKLNTSEKKRQEVINEIFLTEASHVRMLKVLYKLFYKKLVSSQILKPDEINLIFPNIKELLDVHTEINKELRRKRKEDPLVRQIGDTLLATFTGPQGEQLQKAAASFCERQQLALELIKKRRERDNKFDSLLCECEKKRQCRRLELQSIVPYEMQRITRYPLLLERLVESVEAAEKTCSEYKDELVKLREAHLHSKAILGFVDEAAKLAHNRHRLEEIQRHLDVSNFKNSDHPIVNDFRNIDLTRYKLILEGGLQLRRPNKANVHVHVLLMEEMVVIFQKESEKFILKFFQSGSSTPMAPLSPIIKMNTLLARENAVCKNALFLVNTSTTSSQMYDLQAEDESKRETWLKHFTDAAAAYNRREDKITRTTGSISITQPVTDSDSESILREASREPEPVVESADRLSSSFTTAEKEDANQPAETAAGEDDAVSVEDPQAGGDHTPGIKESDVTSGGGGIHVTTKVSAEEWPLIQPSQVSVAVPPVHTAESKLTPLEQIRRKDALVKQTLAEKDDLVADLLAIPREDFQHIADMASTASSNADSHSLDITDRLLATVFQVDILQRAVNDALNITEGDVIAARGGKVPICASQEGATETRSVIPSVPAGLVGEIAASLSSQLTTLLSEIKHVEEDRDRLRKELHKIREQLHEEHHLHSPVPFEDALDPDESAQEIFCEAISDDPN
ncbi:rho guanine nucleotide exchange factor 12 isoform X1 [Dendroctonus ponderosae]|uniref:rho guanine nucleotide exchange factor 12 isoform X1 n=2 Tax=Dendroctonus ponderosae TaxID=77166 RepID=UPI002034F9B5|nr:rho guanine nucleotide exchange factor 12 isoform X1 [Dendroctonus ponderosae]